MEADRVVIKQLKMSTKYKIYRIHVIGNKAWRCEIFTDNIELFRNETADTFKVGKETVKFCYETDELYDEKGGS